MNDYTTPHTTAGDDLDEGVALVMRAEDGGAWRPVIDWLAGHPDRAADRAAGLADFLKVERGLKEVAARVGRPRLDGMELKEEIGRGTFGVVYRARETPLNRDVAVKFVQAFGEADRARFRFEAEAAAGLDHSNVVPVLSYGEANGVPYLVMPLVSGGSLARRLREKGADRFRPEDAAKLVHGIALGTHHAHRRGLIHRDLKPGNVLLDDDDRPRIADFGLARMADASVSTAAGTPAYMAPEQARGDKRLTTAVDVYALGVILFELLAGRTPFGGDSVQSVLRRIQEEPPPEVRSIRPDVPRDLEEVCLRCLAKDPEARYPSAQELADDLSRYLRGEPLGRQTGGLIGRFFRACGRQRETDSMGSWHLLLRGGASVVVAMALLQTAVILTAPGFAWAAIAYYLLAWMGILWAYPVTGWDRLNPVEKNSTLAQMGMVLGCAACLPALTWPDGDVVRVLPAFLAVKGLGTFVHGQWYWGRLYLVGLLYFALAAVMPLIPVAVWPAAFGACSGGIQLWGALHLRRVHRAGRQPTTT